MNKGTLYNFHIEIEGWQDGKSVLAVFHHNDILKFYATWGKRIEEILAQVKDIQKRYLEFEGEAIKRDGQAQAIFLPGAIQADLTREFGTLMMEKVEPVLNLAKPN